MANGRNLSPEMMAQVKDYLRRKTGSSPRPKLRPGTTSPRPRLRPDTVDVSPNAEQGDIELMLQEMRSRGGRRGAAQGGGDKAAMLRNMLMGAALGPAGGVSRAGAMAGKAVAGMKKGGAVRKKKPKNGCTMKGRGGKYKGMK